MTKPPRYKQHMNVKQLQSQTSSVDSHCQIRNPEQTDTDTLQSDIPGPKMRWTFKIGFLKAHAEGNIGWASKGRLKGARVYTKIN